MIQSNAIVCLTFIEHVHNNMLKSPLHLKDAAEDNKMVSGSVSLSSA